MPELEDKPNPFLGALRNHGTMCLPMPMPVGADRDQRTHNTPQGYQTITSFRGLEGRSPRSRKAE